MAGGSTVLGCEPDSVQIHSQAVVVITMLENGRVEFRSDGTKDSEPARLADALIQLAASVMQDPAGNVAELIDNREMMTDGAGI